MAIAAASALTLGVVTAAHAAAPVTQETDVFQVEDGAVVGSATLLRTKAGVTMNISTTVGGEMFDLPFAAPPDPGLGVDWSVGDATTNWFVIFNNPAGCTDPCGEDDVIDMILGADSAEVGIHYAAGHVAGTSMWNAAATLKVGDTSGLFLGSALMDPLTAEVHIVARSHGPMSTIPPGERGYSINSIDGGCGTNICGDAQAAVFAPAA